MDNSEKVYGGLSGADYGHVAFIPAIKDGTPCLGTLNNVSKVALFPSKLLNMRKVFVEGEWTSMGFLALDTAYRQHAPRLGISLRPRVHQIVSFLENNQPKNKVEAQTWFELLAGRVNGKHRDHDLCCAN